MENNLEEQSGLTPPLKAVVVNGKKKIAVGGVVNLYIPEQTKQQQADWNQNDENAPDFIKNRICYGTEDRSYKYGDTDAVYQTEGNTSGYFYYDIPTIDEDFVKSLIGRTFNLKYGYDDPDYGHSEVTFTIHTDEENTYGYMHMLSDGLYEVYGPDDNACILIVTTDEAEWFDEPIDKGLYVNAYSSIDDDGTIYDGDVFDYELSSGSIVAKKIEDKFIPATIARTAQLGGVQFKVYGTDLQASLDGGSTWKTVTLT